MRGLMALAAAAALAQVSKQGPNAPYRIVDNRAPLPRIRVPQARKKGAITKKAWHTPVVTEMTRQQRRAFYRGNQA